MPEAPAAGEVTFEDLPPPQQNNGKGVVRPNEPHGVVVLASVSPSTCLLGFQWVRRGRVSGLVASCVSSPSLSVGAGRGVPPL